MNAELLTPDQAADKIHSHPGGITIRRRPLSGSVPCWGKCGRTISANKALCLACSLKAEADAAATASQTGPDDNAPAVAEADPTHAGGGTLKTDPRG